MVYVYISLPYLFRWFFLFQSCLFLESVLTCSLLNTGFFLAQSSPVSPIIISSANIHNFLYLCNTSFQKCICFSKNRLKYGICHTLCLSPSNCQIVNCPIVKFICCSLCVLLALFAGVCELWNVFAVGVWASSPAYTNRYTINDWLHGNWWITSLWESAQPFPDLQKVLA